MKLFIILIYVTITGVAGDVAMKFAAIGSSIRYFILAECLYLLAGYGWFKMLQLHKLAVVGTIIPILNTLGAVICGVLCFHEQLTYKEMLGLVTGMITIYLLQG